MTGRTCSNCEAEIPAGRSVCPACGTIQRTTAVAGPAPAPGPGPDQAQAPRSGPVASTQGPLQTQAPANQATQPTQGGAGYWSPLAPPPPQGGSPGRKRPGTGKKGPMGCLVVAVVGVVAASIGGYLVWKARQPDPAPLNTEHRSPVSGYGYTFTMDGTVSLQEDHVQIRGLAPSDASFWQTGHDTWDEVVAIVEVHQPNMDAIDVYEASARDLAGRLIDDFNPDVTDTSQVRGRRATEFEGWFRNKGGKVEVGDAVVTKARVKVLVTTLDDDRVVAIAVAEDPKHPAPTDEILTVLESFERG